MHIIEGNVGTVDMRWTPTGKAVVNFSVAVSNDWFDKTSQQWQKKDPTWYNFAAWEDEAIKLEKWLQKGQRVQVAVKRLTLETWEKDGRFGSKISGAGSPKVSDLHKEANGLSSADGNGHSEVEPTDEIS